MRAIRNAVGLIALVAFFVAVLPAAAQEAQIRRYIIVHGNTMTGSWDSNDTDLDSLKQKFGDDFAWFRQDGKEYVVTDAAVLGELRKAMEPQQKVNHMQADVNKEQARVNAMQAQVNAHQGEVNALQHEVNRGEGSQTAVNQRQSQVNQEESRVNAEQDKVNVMQQGVNREQERVTAELNRRVQQILGGAAQRGTAKELK